MARKIPLERVGQMLKVVLTELKNVGGEAKAKDLIERAEPKLNLNRYEREPYEKTGHIRWVGIVHFYSIDCVKAGYITKAGRRWHLTELGERALKKPNKEFIESAIEKYRAWKVTKVKRDAETEEAVKIMLQTAYDEAKDQAQDEIEKQISNLGPYDFQKLVKELLIVMGYHVPFVASPGPDGGIDIFAYKDPIGTSTPRIRVQVKHREQKVNAKEVRELEGLLRKEGDIGLIVSSGGFTSEAIREIRSSNKHIETMDLSRLISLWEQYYDNIRESGKKLLPLVKLFFLAPTEE